MKYKTVTQEELVPIGYRTPEALLAEVKNRLKVMYLNTEGTYELPFDHPMLFDVLKMLLRE